MVCFSILIQYAVIIIFETGELESGTGLSGVFAAVCFVIYVCIFIACRHKISDKQIALVVFCSLFLIIKTFLSGVGFVTMFNYIELVIAITVFARINFPQKLIKHVCLLSVVLYVLILITSRYDDAWLVNRIFTSTRINRNHFGILTVVNMYMALVYFRKPGHSIRPSYVFVYVVGLAIILRSTSRTSLVCVILFIILHITAVRRNPNKTKRLYRFFVAALLISVFAILLLTYVLPLIVGKEFLLFGRPILSGRDSIYSDALDTLVHDSGWFWGRGVVSEFTDTHSIFGTIRLNSHNMWLQFVLNYGVVFTIPLIIIYCVSFKRVIGRRCNPRAAMLVAMQILMFVYFMTEAPHFFRSYSCVYLVFYFTNGSLMPNDYRKVVNTNRRVLQ